MILIVAKSVEPDEFATSWSSLFTAFLQSQLES